MLSVCDVSQPKLYDVPNQGSRWPSATFDVITSVRVGDRHEKARRRLELIVALQARADGRPEGARGGGHARVADLRIEPGGLEVDVVVHGHPHRLVDREREAPRAEDDDGGLCGGDRRGSRHGGNPDEERRRIYA